MNAAGEGAVVLISAHQDGASASGLLGQLAKVGEAFLATESPWHVRRIATEPGARREGAGVAEIRRHVMDLAEADVERIVLVVAGRSTNIDGECYLVVEAGHEAHPEDAAIELRWICERLRTCRADRVLVVASIAGDAEAIFGALATARRRHVIAVDGDGRHERTIASLLAGLSGDAVDSRTGTITLASISQHLSQLPGMLLQGCDDVDTLASTRPLTGAFDPRLTQRNHRAVPPAGSLVNTVLPGRFRIDRELARGSFGTVFQARQLSVERDVAVKVLSDALDTGSEIARMFVQEIQCVGRIDHPNVVRIFQADVMRDGRLFYAMELLSGCDLQQLITEQGVLTRDRATALTLQLLAGLAAAHEVGLVHADIKPANALVVPTRDGERLVLVDFGLARVRAATTVESAGGTPAFMSPEQLSDGRIDQRSDLFSAGLVLFAMLTGWRRRSAAELAPPLELIVDRALRKVLARALAVSPSDRFANAGEFAKALGGAISAEQPVRTSPFRHLAPLTESDRDLLFGRDVELARLLEAVLFRRSVVYTAPSGTGKTSLIRAGLLPRLAQLNIASVYITAREDPLEEARRALDSTAPTFADAVIRRAQAERRRVVLIIDQIEATLLSNRRSELLAAIVAIDGLPSHLEVTILVGVRDDFLALVLSHPGLHGILVRRLGPLTRDEARDAIVGPLHRQRVEIADDLLEVMLDDLQAAAAAISGELKWPETAAAYPPHLQLSCSVLYDSLGPSEVRLTLEHYRRLGGLDSIVGEYLERVLESELPTTSVETAKAILLALVGASRMRVFRSESELADAAGGAQDVPSVLEALRARGLLVRLHDHTGAAGWELVHDSLVARVLGWVDRTSLGRQRAVELVRHRLRVSRPEQPSLLGSGELRELAGHEDAIRELDREWEKRRDGSLRPGELVARSRRARLRILLGGTALVVVALGIAAGLAWRWLEERERRQRIDLLSRSDLGVFVLDISVFDWAGEQQAATKLPASSFQSLHWVLLDPSVGDPLAPAEPRRPLRYSSEQAPPRDDLTRSWSVQARGGPAIVEVTGRGQNGQACAPSYVPLARLPGYSERDSHVIRLQVTVPSCAASAVGQIPIEGGPFVAGGLGDPAPKFDTGLSPNDVPPERVVDLRRFSIDRTEVTNAAFAQFAAPTQASAVRMPAYPPTTALQHADGRRFPVSDVSWSEARAFCRFYGHDLPTDEQWQKAMRGGVRIGGKPNPMPRRNLPWGVGSNEARVGADGPVQVGTTPGDVSAYGVHDLGGNVQEWTATETENHFIVTRGCSWSMCTPETLATFMSIPNARPVRFTYFELGFRCAGDERGIP